MVTYERPPDDGTKRTNLDSLSKGDVLANNSGWMDIGFARMKEGFLKRGSLKICLW
jgi:hypothetical protein